jgi:hypothetical protein
MRQIEQTKGRHVYTCDPPRWTWCKPIGMVWRCDCGQYWRLVYEFGYDTIDKVWQPINDNEPIDRTDP